MGRQRRTRTGSPPTAAFGRWVAAAAIAVLVGALPAHDATAAAAAVDRPVGAAAALPGTQQPAVALCGAPRNPWGYNLCGRGSLIYAPRASTCQYFRCIANFGRSHGYMIKCVDGAFSTAGGRSGACSRHSGVLRPVYGGP
ncbi:MAG: hypothetical protein HY241_16875 [Actinobacteria bacterium]|nr:hypothetical protein [Actinomycetota bacterium]